MIKDKDLGRRRRDERRELLVGLGVREVVGVVVGGDEWIRRNRRRWENG